MLGWLTENLDAAATTHALHALATLAASSQTIVMAAVFAFFGLAGAMVGARMRPGNGAPSKDTELNRALSAYAAQLPSGSLHTSFEIANAEAALNALGAQRKTAGKAQRAELGTALQSASEGDFEPARALFEEMATKEGSRWRRQRPKLATALRHLGTCARLKEPDSAFAAFSKACELEPTNETALMMQAQLLLEAHEPAQAEPILDRLVRLADRDSDPHALVYGLILRGDCRAKLGKLASATMDYERVCEICRAQPRTDETALAWQRPLALAHASLGTMLLIQSKTADAQAHFKLAYAIQSELAGSEPGNIDVLRDLAVTCDRIGDLLLADGDTEGALSSFAESRAIAQRLSENYPRHEELQRDFAVSCSRMGEVLRSLRRLPEALEAFRHDLAISCRLADAAPGDENRQRDLAVAYANVGDMLCALGNPRDALVSFEAAMELLETLRRTAPDDEMRDHELALMRTRIGTAHAKLNAHAEALEAFSAVLTNAKSRAEATPQDAERQHELARAYTRIGNLHLDAAQLDSAVANFDAARQIVERIPEGESENVELRRERALCHGRIALARARGDARDDALAAFHAGHTLLAGINGGNEGLVADDKAWFAGQIAALEVTHSFTFLPVEAKEKPLNGAEHDPTRPAVTVR